MTTDMENRPPDPSTNGQLAIEPRFAGRSYVAVLRVVVAGESVVIHKVDLANDGARQAFVTMVNKRLPAVDIEEVTTKLLKLCDERAAHLSEADATAAEGRDELTLPDLMVRIAFDEADLFHDKLRNAFAVIEMDGHEETWPVKSKGFRLWLRRRLREEHNHAASGEAVSTALEEIESKAIFEGQEIEVAVRLAERPGEIWLDLCDDQWRAVRITATGWEVIGKVPVRFVRARGMLPLEPPAKGGSVTFMAAYTENRSSANETAMEASLVGAAVMHYMAERNYWEGTSSDLLAALEEATGEKDQRRQDWPKTARKLSGELRRVAPNLRRAGLDVQFGRGTGKDRKRLIHLSKTGGVTESPTADRPPPNSMPGMDLRGTADGADGSVRRLENLDVDQREVWEERVAIGMSDGGLSRVQAEESAWNQIEGRLSPPSSEKGA
jgi:hypothetical protein